MKWCCMGFQGDFQMAGSRGFGIFVSTRDSPEPEFILQHRALDKDSPSPKTSYPVSLVSDTHIEFCRWCGARLREFYRKTYIEMDRPDLKV
jgi:hypothetical protein